MNKPILALLLLCTTAFVLRAAPTPFSDDTNAMWLDGNKTGVLAMANKRLQAHSNDIAGLVIVMEYQLEFCDIAHVKATMDKVIAVGREVKTKNFSALYPKLKSDLLFMEASVLPNLPPGMAQSESGKGNIAGKPMDFLYVLRAMESDGLIH